MVILGGHMLDRRILQSPRGLRAEINNAYREGELRIASEITSYSWKIYEHPDIGIAL